MNIPVDLKIISLIYEYRFFALVPFYTAWMLGVFYLLFRLFFRPCQSHLFTAAGIIGWNFMTGLRKRPTAGMILTVCRRKSVLNTPSTIIIPASVI